jgi:hypothetical protein
MEECRDRARGRGWLHTAACGQPACHRRRQVPVLLRPQRRTTRSAPHDSDGAFAAAFGGDPLLLPRAPAADKRWIISVRGKLFRRIKPRFIAGSDKAGIIGVDARITPVSERKTPAECVPRQGMRQGMRRVRDPAAIKERGGHVNERRAVAAQLHAGSPREWRADRPRSGGRSTGKRLRPWLNWPYRSWRSRGERRCRGCPRRPRECFARQ